MANSLPLDDGYLPVAMSIVAALSVYNTIQCFLTTQQNRLIYNEPPRKPAEKGHPAQSEVTGLSCRTFGIWTILAGAVRIYTAFHINDVHCYRLCFLTYICAGAHFLSELLVFKTANLRGAAIGPVITASTMTAWMALQWNNYVK